MKGLKLVFLVVGMMVAAGFAACKGNDSPQTPECPACATAPTGPIQVAVAQTAMVPSEVVLKENPTTRWMKRSSGEVVYQASADGVPICHAPSGSDLVRCPAEVYVDIATVVKPTRKPASNPCGTTTAKKSDPCAAATADKKPATAAPGGAAPPAATTSGAATMVTGSAK